MQVELRHQRKNVSHINRDSPELADIEGQPIRSPNDLDNGLARSMAQRKLVVDVGITEAQVRDHQLGARQMVNDLPGNHPRLANLVRAHSSQTQLRERWLDECR